MSESDDFSLDSDDSVSDDDFAPERPQKTTSKAQAKKPPPTASSRVAKKRTAEPAVSSTAKKSKSVSHVPDSAVQLPVARAAVSTKGPPVASAAEARTLIKNYMLQQNRPFSAIQVFDNLHHRVAKPQVERSLQELCVPGPKCVLRVKDYGKAKIYFPDQTQLETSCGSSSAGDLERRVRDLSAELQKWKARESELRTESSMLSNEPSDDALDQELENLEALLIDRRNRLASLESGGVVTPQEREKAVDMFNFFRMAWRTRKEKTMDIVDMVADGMGKSLKETMVMMGIETDEDEGVSIPPPIKP